MQIQSRSSAVEYKSKWSVSADAGDYSVQSNIILHTTVGPVTESQQEDILIKSHVLHMFHTRAYFQNTRAYWKICICVYLQITNKGQLTGHDFNFQHASNFLLSALHLLLLTFEVLIFWGEKSQL